MINNNYNYNKNVNKGIGFFGLLQLAFIILKIAKVINWSWFWVLSPIIFSTGIFVLAIIALFVYIAIKNKE